MPRIPIFRLGGAPEKPALPNLAAATPFVSLEGLTVGVDNLRHDVVLSPKFVELARAQVARLIIRHGELDRWLERFRRMYEESFDRLDAVLADLVKKDKENKHG